MKHTKFYLKFLLIFLMLFLSGNSYAQTKVTNGDGISNVAEVNKNGIFNRTEQACIPNAILSTTGWSGKVYDAPDNLDGWNNVSSANSFPTASYSQVATFQYDEFKNTQNAFNISFPYDAIGPANPRMVNYLGSAIASNNSDFAISFTKTITSAEAGTYVFDLAYADDHVFLYKNNVKIAQQKDVWTVPQNTYTNFATVSLSAGDVLTFLLVEEGIVSTQMGINATKTACVVETDTDGDGIPDVTDVDDDNDGILDVFEQCSVQNTTLRSITWDEESDYTLPAAAAYFSSKVGYTLAAGPGLTKSSSNGTWTITGANNNGTVADANAKGDYQYAQFTVGSKPLLVDYWAYYAISGGNMGVAFDDDTVNFASPEILSEGVPGPSTVALVSDLWKMIAGRRVVLKANTTYQVRFYNLGTVASFSHDLLGFGFYEANASCPNNDTDADGIPNSLDLDSDNDGCADAVEGGATITYSQLVTAGGTASVGIGSSAVKKNLCASSNCVATSGSNIGLPQFASLPANYSNTTGQTVGDSQNAAVSSQCICYKPAITTGTILDANHGITALGRAGADNSNWPMVRKGAWTVLEAKTKGFVVNRLTDAQVAAIPTANLVEGMMVYNITQDCLQINTDGTATGWKCYKTQTCSDYIPTITSIASLDCANATNIGTLTDTEAASGVSSVISYTGGNGTAHTGQIVSSTGVTGLTATLSAGSFATGNGTLTYNITGTPSGSGTAFFAINIGGQTCSLSRTVSAIFTMPASITLAQNRTHIIASVYDQDYLPYTAPTATASTSTQAANGVNEAVTVDYQGTITTSGITVNIPVTATGSDTLPAFSTTINIPAGLTQDGISRDITLSWAAQPYTSATTSIVANISAVGGTLNAKKLDINAGIGNDALGVLMGQFTYRYNNAGNTTTYKVRDIAGIPDKMFGLADNTGNTATHMMLYLPIAAPDGNIWLSNNLGADYANINKAAFNLAQQATAFDDYKAYGSFFQWGRKPDGHELITWTSATAGTPVNGTTTTRNNNPVDALFVVITGDPVDWRVTQDDTLWATEASANNPCPYGFRVPTDQELTDLFTASGITNRATAASSAMKFPTSGIRAGSGDVQRADWEAGWYVVNTPTSGRIFSINATSSTTNARVIGSNVRCIRN